MSRIAAVFNVPVDVFDRLAPRCKASRLDVEEALRQGAGAALSPGGTTPGLEERIGSAALAAMAPFLQQLGRDAAPRAEDRLWAEALWARWESLPDEVRSHDQEIVVDVLLGDERSWALAERLCLASEAAAANRADEALRLARLAVRLAEHVPGEDWRLRLLGWVEPFLANSQRVGGDLATSARTLARADDLWGRGEAGAPAGLLDDARRLDLKASLLMHYGRFDEVDSLLGAALETPEAPRGLDFLEEFSGMRPSPWRDVDIPDRGGHSPRAGGQPPRPGRVTSPCGDVTGTRGEATLPGWGE